MSLAALPSYSSALPISGDVIRRPSRPNETRITQLRNDAFSCQEVEALYKEACKKGPWSIKFKKLTLESPGLTDFEKRTIYIDPRLSRKGAVTYLIFELINATNYGEAQELKKRILQLNKEEYARECEKIEFKGILKHHEIVSKAIKELGWPPIMDLYAEFYDSDFESYWEEQQFDHADHYRRYWEQIRFFEQQPAVEPIQEIDFPTQPIQLDPAVLEALPVPVFQTEPTQTMDPFDRKLAALVAATKPKFEVALKVLKEK